MNPKPSLYQCLVLHEVADGRVRFVGELFVSGDWLMTGSHRDHKVTRQVEKLIDYGCVQVKLEFPGLNLLVTAAGREVLARRPLHELLEKINRR